MLDFLPFREIWAVDFEYEARPGENPEPVCLVGWELRAGRKVRLWRDQFGPTAPYPTSADVLFLAYYASAEIGCHLALRWRTPARVLDLFTEFRNRTNGLPTPSGAGLYQPAETLTHRRHCPCRARRQYPIGSVYVFAMDVPVGRRQDESGSASFGINHQFRQRAPK